MELALTVLIWTGAACLAMMTIMGVSALAARAELDKARAANERSLG